MPELQTALYDVEIPADYNPSPIFFRHRLGLLAFDRDADAQLRELRVKRLELSLEEAAEFEVYRGFKVTKVEPATSPAKRAARAAEKEE